MAEPIVINFLTGAVPGFDEPTICHSGKPKPNTCYAIAHEPGSAGWVLVQLPPAPATAMAGGAPTAPASYVKRWPSAAFGSARRTFRSPDRGRRDDHSGQKRAMSKARVKRSAPEIFLVVLFFGLVGVILVVVLLAVASRIVW